MISHAHRCIFVHVPKTGGTSLEIFLTGYDWIARSASDYAIYLRERDDYTDAWGGTLCEEDPRYFDERLRVKHATQEELLAQVGPTVWRDYLCFTFVRNPWERVLSVYEHALRDAPTRTRASFHDWLLAPEPLDHMGRPLFRRFISDWDAFDFVGRFERFDHDFRRLLAALGLPAAAALPHERHGSRGRHDATRYDDATRRCVAERCADEIERFGYRFEDLFEVTRSRAAG